MAWAALITWIVTAGFGFFMLGTWIRHGGAKAGAGAASHFRPPVVFGHFLLAAAGLVVWIIYLVTDSSVLSWVAFADLVVVAVLGETLVYRWIKDWRSGSTPYEAPTTSPAVGVAGTRISPAAGTTLAEQQIPSPAVLIHGIFAVATVVLVLLTALGIGGS